MLPADQWWTFTLNVDTDARTYDLSTTGGGLQAGGETLAHWSGALPAQFVTGRGPSAVAFGAVASDFSIWQDDLTFTNQPL